MWACGVVGGGKGLIEVQNSCWVAGGGKASFNLIEITERRSQLSEQSGSRV